MDVSETARIAISTKSIEVDSSSGNVYLEATIIIFMVALLYIGKKLIDKHLK